MVSRLTGPGNMVFALLRARLFDGLNRGRIACVAPVVVYTAPHRIVPMTEEDDMPQDTAIQDDVKAPEYGPASPMLPAAQAFVDKMRALFAQPMDDTERWAKARTLHAGLLADPQVKEHAKTWPESLVTEGKPGNLLFYEDADHGFVINALIKKAGVDSSVHDHGKSWTLYGVLEGGETVARFERTDEGGEGAATATLDNLGEHQVTLGYIDSVPPWEIHAEYNGPHRTVGLIVRSQRSGTFIQNRYDPETGRVEQYNGPVQIPFRLG